MFSTYILISSAETLDVDAVKMASEIAIVKRAFFMVNLQWFFVVANISGQLYIIHPNCHFVNSMAKNCCG